MPDLTIDTDAFAHGQMKSKLWLCEALEPHIFPADSIAIYGSWYNVLGMMLMIRRPNYYSSITGYDINNKAVQVADKICDMWRYEGSLKNNWEDCNKVVPTEDVIINCSPEHIEGEDWFHNIPSGRLVAIQTSNVTRSGHPWLVVNPNPNMPEFAKKFPMSEVLFSRGITIKYDVFGYERYMIIGIK